MARKKVLNIRSCAVEGGKAKQPTADQIDYGEIAVNYAAGAETLFVKNGNKDFELGDNVAFNDLSQEYFTDLNKSAWKSGLKGKPSRFSYVEAYINPSPACLSEAHVRYLKGEKFLPYRT